MSYDLNMCAIFRWLTVNVNDDDDLEEGDDGETHEQREPVHQRHDVDSALFERQSSIMRHADHYTYYDMNSIKTPTNQDLTQ